MVERDALSLKTAVPLPLPPFHFQLREFFFFGIPIDKNVTYEIYVYIFFVGIWICVRVL